MLRLDGTLRRRRWLVLALWVLALAAALPFAARQSENLTGGGFGVPGSQSERVDAALPEQWPDSGRSNLAVVLVPRDGASERDFGAALDHVARATRGVHGVGLTRDARRVGLDRVRRAPGRPLVVPLDSKVGESGAIDASVELRERLGVHEQPGTAADGAIRVHLVGQAALWAAMQEVATEDVEAAERSGFPIIALILLAVFGSLAAAALPLLLGFASVAVTGALIYALSTTMEMSVFVTNMASMIGIGVAVDYSLFVLARYREEIHAGLAPEEARGAALATSGVAVLFSGLTVMASLAGLFMVDATAIRSMATGAILVVAVSMLASATLLPVLIRLLGRRAYARGRLFTVAGLLVRANRWRRRRPGSTAPQIADRGGFWARWTNAVMRRPVVAVLASGLVLLALAVPALDIETSNGALRQLPDAHEAHDGFAAASEMTGEGSGTPAQVVARFREGTATGAENRRAVTRLTQAMRRIDGVREVRPPIPSEDRRSVLLLAELDDDAESAAAIRTVADLRDRLPGVTDAATVRVGGTTGTIVDFRDLVADSMWKILVFVLGLSYIVLLILLRSAVLPLKAVAMNLLSVGAAYGVLVGVFQWGWLEWAGIESSGSLDAITPPLVLAVVFGLSMDYEVFLLTRIRERYAATGDTRRAVAEGLATSARTITSAALIMVAVFLVFVGTGLPSIQQIGLGNAVAIAVDATIVRLALVPAAMELLGRWNWWLPRPLARVLPQRSFEELAPASSR